MLNVLLPWSTVSQKEIGEIRELELSIKCVNLLLLQSIVLWGRGGGGVKLTKSAFPWDNPDQDQ